jgi:hypothetical protein
LASGFEESRGWPAIPFNPAQVWGLANGAFFSESIWTVTITAGTRKIIVTQIHIMAAAHCCSWSGEGARICGAERYDE